MVEEGIGLDRGCQTVIQARQTWGAVEPILPFRVAPRSVKMSPDQVLLPHLALPLMWTALGKGMTWVGWNSETLKHWRQELVPIYSVHSAVGQQVFPWWGSGYCICLSMTYINMNINMNVQFGCSVMSYSLRPHEPQHARPPCPLPTPGVHSNPCPLSRWYHPTISSSVVPFSSWPQSSPASGSFQMSQLFASGGQSIGVSASTSILPMNTKDWSPLGWTGWISLQSKGLSRVFSNNWTELNWNVNVESCLW